MPAAAAVAVSVLPAATVVPHRRNPVTAFTVTGRDRAGPSRRCRASRHLDLVAPVRTNLSQVGSLATPSIASGRLHAAASKRK